MIKQHFVSAGLDVIIHQTSGQNGPRVKFSMKWRIVFIYISGLTCFTPSPPSQTVSWTEFKWTQKLILYLIVDVYPIPFQNSQNNESWHCDLSVVVRSKSLKKRLESCLLRVRHNSRSLQNVTSWWDPSNVTYQAEHVMYYFWDSLHCFLTLYPFRI